MVTSLAEAIIPPRGQERLVVGHPSHGGGRVAFTVNDDPALATTADLTVLHYERNMIEVLNGPERMGVFLRKTAVEYPVSQGKGFALVVQNDGAEDVRVAVYLVGGAMNHEEHYRAKERAALDLLASYLAGPIPDGFRAESILGTTAKVVCVPLPSDRIELIANGLDGISLRVLFMGADRWLQLEPVGLTFDEQTMQWTATKNGDATEATREKVAEAVRWIRGKQAPRG